MVTATLFADEVADLLEFGDWPAAVHRAFELGLITGDEIEHAFNTGADVLANLQR